MSYYDYQSPHNTTMTIHHERNSCDIK